MFFRVLTVVTTILAMSCLSSTTRAEDHIEYYWHNGSLMKLVWDQEVYEFFDIYYEKPRPSLPVNKGTRLLSGGMTADGDVSAEAFVFKQGCPPATYVVTGEFDRSWTLRLTGKAPIRQGCKVVGYTKTNNSVLTFERTDY